MAKIRGRDVHSCGYDFPIMWKRTGVNLCIWQMDFITTREFSAWVTPTVCVCVWDHVCVKNGLRPLHPSQLWSPLIASWCYLLPLCYKCSHPSSCPITFFSEWWSSAIKIDRREQRRGKNRMMPDLIDLLSPAIRLQWSTIYIRSRNRKRESDTLALEHWKHFFFSQSDNRT